MEKASSSVPVLILSYQSCELYCCHLDGFYADADALLRRLTDIESLLLSKPANARFRVWCNLAESRLDGSAMAEIAGCITRLQGRLVKIAFVGLHSAARLKFKRILRKALEGRLLPTAYFTDAELAKGWLI